MYIFTVNLFCSLVIVCNSAGAKKGESKILELKTDVDKIGDDLGNLAFDVVKQVMGKVSMFQVNGDYDTGDETEEETTQPGYILDNLDTTEADKSMVSSAKNVLESYSEAFSKRRPKRSAGDVPNKAHEPSCENSKCPEKTLKEQALEHQHIEDLKEEVNKLYDLVLLLRDQQKVMSLLGEETRNMDNALPKRFSARNFLKVLNQASNTEDFMRKDKSTENNSISDRKPAEIIIKHDDTERKTTQEELAKIKYDLREAIVALNKTRSILVLEKEKELALENELKGQRLELNFLKVMVAKLLKNNTNYSKGFFPKTENFTIHSSEILGSPLHSPKALPVSKLSEKTKATTHDNSNEDSTADRISRTSENNDADQAHMTQHVRTRASELEDLERLLVKINKPKKSDVESKMFELQREGEKKRQDDDFMKKLILLQRLVTQQRDDKSTNPSPDDDSDLIKMLQIATKNMNKPQSKIVDDDVELELEKLQEAINGLRPKDEWELPREEHETRTDAKKLRAMLKKIFTQQAKQDIDFFETGNKNHQLSPREIEALAKEVAKAKIVGGETTETNFPPRGAQFPGNGYGYLPPYAGSLAGNYICSIVEEELPHSNLDINASDIFGNGPFPSEPSSRWYGNFAQNFPPYGNQPYQPLTNRMLNTNNYAMPGTPSNTQFSSYSAATGNIPPNRYRYQNFGQYPPYKSMAMTSNQHNFDANLDPNTHQSSSNFYQKLFGNPLPVPPHNYGIGMEPNTYQSSSDNNYQKQFLKPQTNLQNFGAVMDQNTYQSSSDLHQRPYVEPLAPNQYNFEANMEQNGYPDPHQQPFGVNAAPSSFAKPSEQGPPPTPYSQASSNGYKQLDVKNQFFPVPQPSGYEKTITKTFYSQSNIAGGGTGQPGAYPQQNTENEDYRHQKIEDLKKEIYSLQNVINDLNKPDYTQKPEDKETVATLEQQINELNGVINSLNQDVTPNLPNYPSNPSNPPGYEQNNAQPPQPTNYEKSSRRRRSVGGNQIASDEDSKLYDQVVSKVKQFFFEKDNQTEERSSYDDISRRIAALKNQLESRIQTPSIGQERTFDPIYPANTIQNSYQPPYQYSNLFQNMPSKVNKNEVIKSKKNDLFTSIVIKILDKVLAATPAVIEKLFGAGLTQLTNFGDDYSYGDSYGGYNVESGSNYDIQKLFKNLGFLGYGPLIFLKLIDGFTTIVNILKKNKFLKNFLMPALILLVVAGSVLFLVWWLQPDKDYYGYNHNSNSDYSNKNYGHYPSNNNYQDSGYNNNNYYYVPNRSYNTPVYSRSYFENGQ